MPEIVRYQSSAGPTVGVREAGTVRAVPGVGSLAELLRRPRTEIAAVIARPGDAVDAAQLLAPVDGRTEVWGAGVTYERSRIARVEESATADVYDLVYVAERPELFLKAPAWRVVPDGAEVGIRRDSLLNVPEPELALWITAGGEIAGYLVCNDMTSRSIEAANPLYLPQAKIYDASCALSTGIVPFTEVDPSDLRIASTITRGDDIVWQAETSTASMARSLDELVQWLMAELEFPDGVVLSTGTGIVPDLDFVLEPGDLIVTQIEGVGTLSNSAVHLR